MEVMRVTDDGSYHVVVGEEVKHRAFSWGRVLYEVARKIAEDDPKKLNQIRSGFNYCFNQDRDDDVWSTLPWEHQ
jgi:hypothetical protein